MFQNLINIVTNMLSKQTTTQQPSDLIPPQIGDSQLEVYFIPNVYNSQRDNKLKPSTSCNITTVEMLLHDILIKYNLKDDDLMAFLNDKDIINHLLAMSWAKGFEGNIKSGKPEQVWSILEWLCNKVCNANEKGYEVKNYLTYNFFDKDKIMNDSGYNTHFEFNHLTLGEIATKLKTSGKGIITSGNFTSSGHLVLIVGYILFPTGVSAFIINDPWGDSTTNYSTIDGEYRIYTNSYLNKMLKDDGKLKGKNKAFRTISAIVV